MGKYIVRLQSNDDPEPWFVEWSTVVDAPVTYGMRRNALDAYISEQYGREGLDLLPGRRARCEAKGTSALHENLDDLLSCNRAGAGETHLTLEQIIDVYCLNRGEILVTASDTASPTWADLEQNPRGVW